MATWPEWLTVEFEQLLSQYRQNRLPHALLMVGQSGDGATVFNRRLAQSLLCVSSDIRPCGQCKSCQLFQSGYHPDFITVEPEGKSQTIKVEAIRDLIRKVTETAQQGGNKVVWLKSAESMNVNAANALLKVLEEPTDKTFLILQAGQIAQMLPTIRSRCRIIQLPRPDIEQSVRYLAESDGSQPPAVLLGMVSNRPLDALELTEEQVNNWFEVERKFTENHTFTELSQFLAKQELSQVLKQAMLWVDTALRYQQNPKINVGSVSEKLLKSLAAHDSVSLFRFRGYIIDRLMGFQRQANLNVQLMSEEFAWQWLGLRGMQ